jgi:hypothetical protein
MKLLIYVPWFDFLLIFSLKNIKLYNWFFICNYLLLINFSLICCLQIGKILKENITIIKGSTIEDNKFCVTVHYRRVKNEKVWRFIRYRSTNLMQKKNWEIHANISSSKNYIGCWSSQRNCWINYERLP